MKEIPISKKESGCIPPRFVGDTLSKSRFDFENRTQSEARELPTSGHDKCDGGPYNGADSVHCPLIYIYNEANTLISNQQRVIAYHHVLMAKHCRRALV